MIGEFLLRASDEPHLLFWAAIFAIPLTACLLDWWDTK